MHNNKRRQNNGGNGGQQNRHNNNRPRRFGGNGPRTDDSMNVSRQRRNATQAREKYQNLARDAMSIGDRVLAENYLQHADHYYRVLMALPPEEIRQPYLQRGNPGQPEDVMPASSESSEHHSEDSMAPMGDSGAHTSGHALPAFITQPAASQENPPE